MSHTRSREYLYAPTSSDSSVKHLLLDCTARFKCKGKGYSILFITELLAIDFVIGCVSFLNPPPLTQREGNIMSYIVLLCTTGLGFSREPRVCCN